MSLPSPSYCKYQYVNDNVNDDDETNMVEDLFSEMLSRIQGYEEKQVSEEVMKTVSEAILELVRTLKEVSFNLMNMIDVISSFQ